MAYGLSLIVAPILVIAVLIGIPALIIYPLIPRVEVLKAPAVMPYQTPEFWSPSQSERIQEEVSESPVLPFEEVRKSRRRHVLDRYAENLKGRVDMALGSVLNQEGTIVHVAGVVVGKRELNSKAGLMATLVLEDPSGRAECIIYPMTYLAHPVDENQIILLNGKVSNSKILVNGLEVIGKKRQRRPRKEGITPCESVVI